MDGQKIGYIGLGVMGLPFAGHLHATGHDVFAYDKAENARAAAGDKGLNIAAGIEDCVAFADVLFTCLPNPDAVKAVYAEVGKPGLVCCDNSTIGPTLAKTLEHELRSREVGYVECPMLGGVGEAERGELFLITSGDEANIARVLPLALAAARDHRIVGGPGSASLFKTVQNGLGHIQAAGIAEALALVAGSGGDLDQFIDVVGAGGGMAATPLFRAKAPMMRDLSSDPVGKLYIAAKDACLAATLADEMGLDLQLFRQSAAIYEAAMNQGLAEADMAAIIRVLEKTTGAKVAKG